MGGSLAASSSSAKRRKFSQMEPTQPITQHRLDGAPGQKPSFLRLARKLIRKADRDSRHGDLRFDPGLLPIGHVQSQLCRARRHFKSRP